MTQTAVTPHTPLAAPAKPPAPGAGDSVRLNTFQRLMRRWAQLGPYNAGQVMLITGRPDVDRWRAAAEAAITELGLGRPVFAADGGTADDKSVRFLPASFIPIEEVACGLEDHINEELNRPFADDELPIRFFVRTTDNGAHHFGAIYNHWIADSRAMRELMQRIFVRYQSPDGPPAPLPRLTLQQPGNYAKLFGRYVLHLPRTAALWEMFRNLRQHRHSYRINLREPLDFHSQTIYRQLPPGLIERVHRWAKQRQASVNDVFLAALGQAMGKYTAPERLARKKKRFHFNRHRVGLGTIVDIRDWASQNLDDVFGLYLSSYTVALAQPEKTPVADLVGAVNTSTRRIKKANLAIRGYCALTWARFWWDRLPKAKNKALIFQKNVPQVAGISNVNMTGSWVDQPPATSTSADDIPMIQDYLRISPTGPLLPLVFTLTTIHDRLSLFVTYRTTAFTPQQAEGIVDDFMRILGEVGA